MESDILSTGEGGGDKDLINYLFPVSYPEVCLLALHSIQHFSSFRTVALSAPLRYRLISASYLYLSQFSIPKLALYLTATNLKSKQAKIAYKTRLHVGNSLMYPSFPECTHLSEYYGL